MSPDVASIPEVVLAAIGGWLVGALSAWITLRLCHEPPDHLSWRDWPTLDILVQAGLAIVWAALVWRLGPTVRWAAAALLAVPLVQVAVTDFRTRHVYTAITIAGTVGGLALAWLVFGPPWWAALAGALGGFVLFFALYRVGRLAYRGGEPLARGDIYIAVMIGAVSGPRAADTLILGILLGGALALVYLAVKRSRKAYMPYGPGLCAAALVALLTA